MTSPIERLENLYKQVRRVADTKEQELREQNQMETPDAYCWRVVANELASIIEYLKNDLLVEADRNAKSGDKGPDIRIRRRRANRAGDALPVKKREGEGSGT